MDIQKTLETLVGQVVTQLDVDAVDVLLVDPAGTHLTFAIGRGFQDPDFGHNARLQIGEPVAGQIAASQQSVYIPDLNAPGEDNALRDATAGEDFVSYFGLPLVAKGEVVGVLELFHRSLLNPDLDWLDFMNTLAGQASIAVDNATLFDSVQRANHELELAYDATLDGWSRALELRDEETEGHTRRVTDLTLDLAAVVGLPAEEMVNLRRGARLHDIGKMGIPDTILLKPGPLDEAEWVVMKKHTTYAYEMLQSIDYLKDALDIPYCHHERWDGSGYPRGLKGEQIPRTARIFAVADVFDALTNDRPYRQAWSKERAVEYIQKQSGSHFDPDVVEAFMSLVDRL